MHDKRQLSKRESKYRKKFIAEHHYNKDEQHIFDEAVRADKGYVKVYKNAKNGKRYFFMTVILKLRMERKWKDLGKAFLAFGSCLRFAKASFECFGEALRNDSKRN